jgi:hypothetical protein
MENGRCIPIVIGMENGRHSKFDNDGYEIHLFLPTFFKNGRKSKFEIEHSKFTIPVLTCFFLK